MPISTVVERLKRRRTKIVATLGPASDAPESIESLIRSGVDVFRLNFSHGEREAHSQVYRAVRDAGERAGVPVGILADLGGPKIRVGRFEEGEVVLEAETTVYLTTDAVLGAVDRIPVSYAGIVGDVEPGDPILLDDGNLELRVEKVGDTEVACTVVRGGVLKDRKGLNLPGTAISIPALTEKDRDDARLAMELGADFLALSFVRHPSDVELLRDLVDETNPATRPWIISKIEKPQALDEIDGILDLSDGIMVARGDLGVELPPESVPIAQSQLIDAARSRSKPVIVATQMLESMVTSARPTRAEVSDVSNAVRGGADAVMLSGETAVGKHAVAAVEMMDAVARETEGYLWKSGAFEILGRSSDQYERPLSVEHAVTRATTQLSRDLMVRSIVVFTRGGWTALQVSSGRPQAPVLAVTPNSETLSRLALLWGVVPVLVDWETFEERSETTRKVALQSGLVEEGHHVLQVRGFHQDGGSNRPSLTVCRV